MMMFQAFRRELVLRHPVRWLALAILVVGLTFQTGWSQHGGRRITLETKDGVKLVCWYFPGANGETTIPIILVHEWDENGSELLPLATFLNSAKAGQHAVIVPDLRGHGESTTRVDALGTKLPEKLSASRMRKADIEKFVTQDLETVKRFLVTEHNQRKLNIDMLCIVGSDMGALVALYWTTHDWNWSTLSGGRQQGRDVKALVMISPPSGFKGVSINPALAHEAIRDQIAIQILYGKRGKPANSARRIHSTLGRQKGRGVGYDFRSFDTSLQGAALFTEKQLNVAGFIASFIKQHVADHQETMPWKPRETSGAKASDSDQTESG